MEWNTFRALARLISKLLPRDEWDLDHTRKCESCGIEIDFTTSLAHHQRCKACDDAREAEYWTKTLRELKAAGVDLTREAEIDFVYCFFCASDAEEMAGKVKSLGFEALLQRSQHNLWEEWSVRCRTSMVPSRDSIEAALDTLCEFAYGYENWYHGWGVVGCRNDVDAPENE